MRFTCLIILVVACTLVSPVSGKTVDEPVCGLKRWSDPEFPRGTLPEAYHRVKIPNPPEVGSSGGGDVVVRITVTKEGAARDIEILCAERPGDHTRAVRDTLSKWRFDPAINADGKLIDFPGKIVLIEFDLAEAKEPCSTAGPDLGQLWVSSNRSPFTESR
jgi:TonB family protein